MRIFVGEVVVEIPPDPQRKTLQAAQTSVNVQRETILDTPSMESTAHQLHSSFDGEGPPIRTTHLICVSYLPDRAEQVQHNLVYKPRLCHSRDDSSLDDLDKNLAYDVPLGFRLIVFRRQASLENVIKCLSNICFIDYAFCRDSHMRLHLVEKLWQSSSTPCSISGLQLRLGIAVVRKVVGDKDRDITQNEWSEIHFRKTRLKNSYDGGEDPRYGREEFLVIPRELRPPRMHVRAECYCDEVVELVIEFWRRRGRDEQRRKIRLRWEVREEETSREALGLDDLGWGLLVRGRCGLDGPGYLAAREAGDGHARCLRQRSGQACPGRSRARVERQGSDPEEEIR